MGELAGISGERAVRALLRAGFVRAGGKGSHAVLKKPGGPTIVIPLHKEVSPNTLRGVLKLAGMTVVEFRALL